MVSKLATLHLYKVYILLIFIGSCNQDQAQQSEFNINKDLLLLHYDCKTDVDDLHSVAAAGSLIRTKKYSKLKYHAVAGAYGIQQGLYVPGESLFELAFGNHWSDAHKDHKKAIRDVHQLCLEVLEKGGNIWIAEAGQSDFSTDLTKSILTSKPNIDSKDRITIVQHSEWNESVTEPSKLAYAKSMTNYVKIEDGNILNNGTPGFNTIEDINWKSILPSNEIKVMWNLAIQLANQYNGKENRYLNKTIKQNGFDFSDFSEVHFILGLTRINAASDYFEYLRANY